MRQSNLLRAFLTIAGLLLWMLTFEPNRAFAQAAGSGTITGSVTDPTGAVVPGADIIIRNTDTGVERKIGTTDAGLFTAMFLPPGHYEVQTSKKGFATVLRKDLTLQVGQTLTINTALAVETTQQEVTVRGAASVVDAEKTDVSQVVSAADVSNLPIAGRRWDQLALTSPNATNDGSSGLVSYRGISGLYNSQMVDGANNNQALFSEGRARATSGAYVFSMDSMMEYQVSTSNYSAELGQAAGGVVNAVTKSGTNDLHGDLFYYLRYPTWNALDPLPKSQGNYTQPIHQWQQFGGSVGGADHQGQAVLLRNLRRVAQSEPHRLHQQHLQRQHESAALPGAGDGHAVRQCQCVPLRPAGDIPARHQSGRGFRQAGRPC